jgi:hypothetical protein
MVTESLAPNPLTALDGGPPRRAGRADPLVMLAAKPEESTAAQGLVRAGNPRAVAAPARLQPTGACALKL